MEKISLTLSSDHFKYETEVKQCFKNVNFDKKNGSFIKKSFGDLPMSVMIFIAGAILSGITWDFIKIGIKKVYKKFHGENVGIIIMYNGIMFSIDKNENVSAVTLNKTEFSKIKTLDDLYKYMKEQNK